MIAGIIGVISGLVLLKGSIPFGLWVITYSMIQFVEAMAYKGFDIPPTLVVRLLYLQGIVFIGSSMLFDNKRTVFDGLCLCFVLFQFIRNFNGTIHIDCNDGCTWTKNSQSLSTVYMCMGIMFLFGIVNYHWSIAAIYAFILAFSVFMQERGRYPSVWCLYSAFVAPLLIPILVK